MLFRTSIMKHGLAMMVVTFFSLLILTLPAQAALSLSLSYYNHDTLYTKLNNTTDLTVSNGTAPYTVTASNSNLRVEPVPGSTVRFRITTVSPGKTTVTVRDARGQVATKDFTIANDVGFTLSTSNFVVGQKFTATISGGIPPYTLKVNRPNTGTIKALSANTFEVTPQDTAVSVEVRDSKRSSTMFHITAKAKADFVAPLKAWFSIGQIDVNASTAMTVAGGTAPYTVSASNTNVTVTPVGPAATTTTFNVKGVAAGTAVVTVRDNKGQVVSNTITVKSNAPHLYSIITATTVNVGQSVDFQPMGGVAPYRVTAPANVRISQLATNKFRITGVSGGKIRIIITDAAGTQAGTDLTVIAPSLTIALSPESVGVGQGRSFTVSGGKAPFTVVSANPGIARIEARSSYYLVWGVSAGTTQIVATDSTGARAQSNVVVSGTKSLNITAPQSMLRGGKDYLVVASGNPPYMVTTSNHLTVTPQGKDSIGRDQYLLTANAPGSASVTVRDSKGQTITRTIMISDSVALTFPDFPEGTLRAIDVGQTTRVIVSGGAAPYIVTTDRPGAVTIQQQGPNQFVITGRQAGVVNIIARDQRGATRGLSLTIRNLPTMTVTAPSQMVVGQNAILSIIGGARPFFVTPSGNQITLVKQNENRYQITARTPGNVTITVRDSKGTTKTLPITVTPPAPPKVAKLDAVVTRDTLYLNGTIQRPNYSTLMVMGGREPFQIIQSSNILNISPQGRTPTGSFAYGLAAKARGTTTLTVRDQSGQQVNITIRVL